VKKESKEGVGNVFARVFQYQETCGTNDGHDFSADFLCVNIIEYRAQARLMPAFRILVRMERS
jgi:hypothetical protein